MLLAALACLAGSATADMTDESVANPLLDYFRHDTGREDPRRMIERDATVIERLTGLEIDPLPRVEFVSRGDVMRTYSRQSSLRWDTTQDTEARHQIALFRALGLIAGDLGATPLGDIAGIYDPADKRVLLLRGASSQERAQTLVHELVHAAQDQAIGLEDYQDRHTDTLDATLAAAALLEGQAQAVQILQLFQSQMPDQADDYLSDLLPQPVDLIPTPGEHFLDELSLFPYTTGALFVLQRYQAGQERDFAAMLARVPTTTEQILHRDKFVAGETPTNPPLKGEAARVASAMGGNVLYETRVGELVIASFFATYDAAAASQAAAGWNGDWAALVETSDGTQLVLLDTVWDSQTDTQEALAVTAPEAMLDASANVRVLAGDMRVLFLIGPDQVTARAESALRRLRYRRGTDL